MKTVMISMQYGLVARNVLRTEILSRLREAGCRVVVVCPAAREPYFQQEFCNDGVVLEPFPRIKSSLEDRVFAKVTNTLLFSHPGMTKTITIKWLNSLGERAYGSFIAKGLASPFLLRKSRTLRHAAESVDSRHFAHPAVLALLEAYRPDVVVTTNLFGQEHHFHRVARRMGIRSVCLVKSWDNLTSKTRIRVHPDHIVVWSDLQKQEAVDLHFFPEERIHVAGAPNFDHYAKEEFRPTRSREAFLRSIGAEPDRKLVLYSPANKLTYSDEENIRMLHRILEGGMSGRKCHLHIRKYPKAQKEYSHLLTLSNLSVEDAGIVVKAWSDRVDQPFEEMRHLRELMMHTDVLVQIGSTIALDAACFDKPIVAYFPPSRRPDVPWYDYMYRVRDFTHNRYLEDTGGVRVVCDEQEMTAVLARYLQWPETDSENRRAMVERIAGPVDGKAGRRTADFVLSLME
jgi:hypothetical protein